MAEAGESAVIAEIRDVLTAAMDAPAADRATAALAKHFAGSQIYFPVAHSAAARHAQIRGMAAAGAGPGEICRKLQISRTTLYRVLSAARQPSLP